MAKAAKAKRTSRKAKDESVSQSAAMVGFEAKLWAAADKLLPKLFFGEIRTPEGETAVEEVIT